MLSTIFSDLYINDLPLSLTNTSNGNNETPKLRDANISLLLFANDLAIFFIFE